MVCFSLLFLSANCEQDWALPLNWLNSRGRHLKLSYRDYKDFYYSVIVISLCVSQIQPCLMFVSKTVGLPLTWLDAKGRHLKLSYRDHKFFYYSVIVISWCVSHF